MENKTQKLKSLQIGELCFGFKLEKKEFVKSKSATLYTLRHDKTGARLFYFDRADENKTFCVSFKTLPENDTGVFHILEHSVLNGSDKFPAKEPFLSMLQSSMQTFLNAMTFSDKTVFPISSRNEKDFFNLMQVYLDAVFYPMIYKKPEIFMQEGWHYEFDEDGAFYNGVVFSEMKGVYADVDSVIEEETMGLLFPDNSYGFSSGGHPYHIPDLTYEQFIQTHKRFYHPTNAIFFLDGDMNADAVLEYIDSEYLSKYEYRKPDFDFVRQVPKAKENTVYYQPREGEEDMAHMSVSKIICDHDDVKKIYAMGVLADYLTGSNEAPLKRAFLEKDIAQDVNIVINDGIYQPAFALVVNNVNKSSLGEIKDFLPSAVKAILSDGINKEALSASLERAVFLNKEITEPYGVELAVKLLDGCLYGDDPLTHIDNDEIYNSLRDEIDTDYFSDLLSQMLSNADDKSYLYVLPSLTKGEDDEARENEKIEKITANWSEDEFQNAIQSTQAMQQWQQSVDTDEVIATLPHLDIKDVQPEVVLPEKKRTVVDSVEVLKVSNETNGIVYLNMFFNISDFTQDELFTANLLAYCLGELHTKNYSADALQTKIKSNLGSLSAKIELTAKAGDLENCTPYFLISAGMLEEKVPVAIELIKEILEDGMYDETDRLREMIMQRDYALKQSLVSDGHVFAVTKALSAFSAKGAMKEAVEGDSFVKRFSNFASEFDSQKVQVSENLAKVAKKAFAKNRLFIGYSGELSDGSIKELTSSLEINELGVPVKYEKADTRAVDIDIPAGVGFSAFGHNLYALGSEYKGSCAVLSTLVSYTYLWNEVRVQGGAYGTGMRISQDGNMYCYSYRDPDIQNTLSVFENVAEFVSEFIKQGVPLDDMIIGTVNTTDPLLEPSELCNLECVRHINAVTNEDIQKIRKEILSTTADDVMSFIEIVKKYECEGKFCKVANAGCRD